MDNQPVTIKDLAKKLRMSVSTVSKAFNNYPNISEMTRTRVQEMARQLNYVPNQSAILFKQKKTFTIGVIIPDLLDQYYTLAATGIEDAAMEQGYRVIICQSREQYQLELEHVEMMKRNRIDGLLISITKNTCDLEHLKKLEDIGIPVVFFGREPENYPCHSVVSNVYKAASEAVDYLVNKGHRRIAHIKGPDTLFTSEKRLEGYRAGLKRNGIPFDETLVRTSDLSAASTHKAISELMALASKPTAVVAFKDYVAIEAQHYLYKQKISHSQNIDFVGFGNIPMLQYLTLPPIASMDGLACEIGYKAMGILLQLIKDKNAFPEYQQIQLDAAMKIYS